MHSISIFFFFFFNDTATTEIYTLSLHDALPIWRSGCPGRPRLASLRRGVTIPATGSRGDGPRAHRGLYREEARPWRKDPHHQRAPGEPQRAGGLCGGAAGLTSPTSLRCPPRNSERCDAWDGPPWVLRPDD